MSLYRVGLLLCGLSYNGSTEATLFTDGPLDVTTLPGTLSPLSASTQLAQRMLPGGIAGVSCRVGDLRSPLVSANTPEAQLQDTAAGELSALFAPDPGWVHTTRWTILNKVKIEKADTSLVLTGPTAPTVNQLIWLGNECLKVTAVSSSALDHTVTVIRAQCGSRAMVHALDPEAYPDGDNGSRESMTVYSRQVFDGSRRIEAALYHFRMSDNNPHAVTASEWVWYGYLESRPKQNADMVWSVPVKHYTKAIDEAVLKGGAELELSHVVESSWNPSESGYTTNQHRSFFLRLTVYEFEKLFNEAIHAGQSETIDNTLMTSVRADLLSDPKIGWEFDADVGGYRWIFTPTDYYTISDDNYQPIIYVACTKVAATPYAATGDNPANYPAADGFTVDRDEGYNAGFVGSLGDVSEREYRVRVSQGETAPKVKLRLRIKPASWAQASLYLLLSHHGGGDNHATYDQIVGARGFGFNPDWVNIGSAPADPFGVGQGNREWLSHHATHRNAFEYGFHPGDKLGDWFRNECALRCAVLAFAPSTGKIGARIWARTDTPTALNPIVHPDGIVEPGETLSELKALFLERGIDPLTLQSKFRKPLQLEGARAQDTRDAPTIRVWRQGYAFTDAELASGPLAALERAVFGVGLGTPRLFAIPLTLHCGIDFADLVTWTDPSIPTSTGRGLTTHRLIVLGFDRKMSDGKVVAYCLEDVMNAEDDSSATNSSVATGLRISGLISIDVTNRIAEVYVEPLSQEQAFNGSTADSSLWSTIAAASGHIKVSHPNLHNPFAAGERRGPQEMYVKLTTLMYDAGLRQTYLRLTWVASQTTDRSVDPTAIITPGATVQLPERRPSTAMPGALALVQVAALAGATSDRVIVASAGRRQRWDGRRSLISDSI